MEPKWIKPFVNGAGIILFAAALIRFLIVAGNAPFLSLSDPLLGLPLRYTVLLAGVLELSVALICLFGKQLQFQIAWLAWLMTNFLVFQAGLFWTHCHVQATCIGSLTDPLRLSRGWIGVGIRLLPLCLAAGSFAAAAGFWLTQPVVSRYRAAQAHWQRMFCPACGGHIKFATQNLGLVVPCPHCGTTATLRKDEQIKMSCYFCEGHIGFPAHALGQKIKCPHCSRDITLKETN